MRDMDGIDLDLLSRRVPVILSSFESFGAFPRESNRFVIGLIFFDVLEKCPSRPLTFRRKVLYRNLHVFLRARATIGGQAGGAKRHGELPGTPELQGARLFRFSSGA